MKEIIETVAPIVLLAGLGAVLAHLRFLGPAFVADLNKLAFWVALPALLFSSAARCPAPQRDAWELFGLLAVATLLVCGASYGVSAAFRFPHATRGTLAQSTFRGNLVYIGIPVLILGTNPDSAKLLVSKTVFVVIALMVVYNVLAVVVLRASDPDRTRGAGGIASSLATNPLMLSGLAGLLWGTMEWPVHVVAGRFLDALAGAAIPISLLCIGGTLAAGGIATRAGAVAVSVSLKMIVLPLLVWGLCAAWGMDPADTRIAMVLAACPTAAASYVMASRMGGDQQLASAAVAATTLCATPVIVWILWITSP
jgi:malate permease and related proteins